MRPILLVEDNPDDEALALRAFRKHQLLNPVIVARDGVEALETLFTMASQAEQSLAQLPQVILLDLQLPRIDGLEVLQRLRANPLTALLPVVVLTSSREDSDITTAYRSGANSYLHKPVDFLAFSQMIHHLGTYWLSLNEPPLPAVS